MNRSRASGTPCGSVFGRFSVLYCKNRFPKIKFATEWTDRELLGRPVARYSAVFVFYCTQNVKIDFLKFNLLPNEPIESFWDALWLGIRPFFCFCHVTFKRIKHTCLISFSYCRHIKIMENRMIFPKNRSRASGTPCGSAFARFCAFVMWPVNFKNMPFW